MCRLISYDIMMGRHKMAMIADMTIRHDDAIYYSVMIDCKGDENTLQMMIMIMVIIMILIIVRNHSDDDGDHSNITRLSLIDDIDGDDKEQDFISMIWISIDFITYNRAVPQLISLLTTGQYHKDNHLSYRRLLQWFCLIATVITALCMGYFTVVL